LPPTRKKTPDPLDSNEPPAAQGPLDLGKHLFPQLLRRGVYLHAYRSPEYVKDAGTPQRIVQVERDLASGRVGRMSLRTPSPAVFLDRDGTLNEEVHFLSRADQMRLLPGVAEAVARLNASDYRTVVVTNQPVIARGDCDEAELQQIHNRLETLLGNEGAYLDAIYYCPHGPEAGHPGERAELKIACECRKPGIGMIQQAARELNLDLSRSWMIGDKTADVLAAQRAGMRSVLVGTGYAGRDGKYLVQADFECRDLAEAVDLILCRRTHRAAVAEVAAV
jgi:histidinol-phosphate phosphatase family protein